MRRIGLLILCIWLWLLHPGLPRGILLKEKSVGKKSKLSLSLLATLFLLFSIQTGFTQTFPDKPDARLGKGHIWDIDYSPDGELFAGAGSLGVWVYNLQNLEVITLFQEHGTTANCVKFHPGGQLLASASDDGTVRLWKARSGEQVGVLRYDNSVFAVAFSPDGETLASGGFKGIHLWDMKSKKQVGFLEHGYWVRSLSFSPDGNLLASGGTDDKVRIWNVRSGEQIDVLEGYSEPPVVAFSPNGELLASACRLDPIRLWDMQTREEIGVLGQRSINLASYLAFDPSGKTLLSSTETASIALLNVATGEQTMILRENPRGWVNKAIFSPDGRMIASTSGSDGTIRFWSVVTGTQTAALDGHTGIIQRVSFSPDGKTLASSEYSQVRLWNIQTQEQVATLQGRMATFSLDGQLLATDGGWTIDLWDATTLAKIDSIELNQHGVFCLSFSPDGRLLASGGSDGVSLWTIDAKERLALLKHPNIISAATFSPDGRLLAYGTSDGTVSIWDMIAEEIVMSQRRHDGRINSLAFSPNGELLASGSNDTTIRLWNASAKTQIGVLTGPENVGGIRNQINSVAFSPDGRLLAVGSVDRRIRLWDVKSREVAVTLADALSFASIGSVDFSEDGKLLASGSKDGTVLLWSMQGFVSSTPSVEWDVNRDKVVDVKDLVVIGQHFGESPPINARADVNGDVVVDILDLVLVGQHFGESHGSAAPSMWVTNYSPYLPMLKQIQIWTRTARGEGVVEFKSLLSRLIALGEDQIGLLASFLGQNYPNPFNPDTWFPYQLAEPADVKIHIYDAQGRLVRTLDLGHRDAGIYQSQNRAAYWDGRSDMGETMSSGIYFYHLQAGNFQDTRRMVILR